MGLPWLEQALYNRMNKALRRREEATIEVVAVSPQREQWQPPR